MFSLFIPYVQTIVKKASVLLDSNASIHRSHRLYYTYLSQSSSSSWGNLSSSSSSSSSTKKPYSINLNKEASVEHLFGRPMVVMKLGQYIMDVKVSLLLQSIYRLSLLSYIIILYYEVVLVLCVYSCHFSHVAKFDEEKWWLGWFCPFTLRFIVRKV